MDNSDNGVKTYLGNNAKFKAYKDNYNESIKDKMSFWKSKSALVDWITPFKKVFNGSFADGKFEWFIDGKLNAAANCVDRHLPQKSGQTAIIWEGDDGSVRKITFSELHENVCRLANFLRRCGVQRGENICIYLPMIPEAAYAILACARIGAVHNVVFAGFSASALAERVEDCGCKVLITAEKSVRGGKTIPLLRFVKEAVGDYKNKVKKILVYDRGDGLAEKPSFLSEKEVFVLPKALEGEAAECPAEPMDSEDPLFLLYTSGSTGKPKGLVHSTGGFLVYAAWSHRTVFDVRDGDIFGCVADVGWITGHTYVIYGPLLNGTTTFMFESTPLFPSADRYWAAVAKHRMTQFYTSPTAIRAVQKHGAGLAQRHDLSSLRVVGSVGEPINCSAWHWYFEQVAREKASVVDTYWQTETGGIIISPLPGVTPLKPGSATFPLPGVEPVVVDPLSREQIGPGGKGVLCLKSPLPGMARTIYKNHKAYLATYLEKYEGYYYTGDGAYIDEEGYIFITGRVDDVLSISGHRVGTAEIESAITKHPQIIECAVVAVPDSIKGQKWLAFVIPKKGDESVPLEEVLNSVRFTVGHFAAIGSVLFVRDLPKTRSGKVMRRALRKIACGQKHLLGDVSTLTNPAIVEEIASLLTKNKEMLRLKRKISEL